MLTDDWLAGCRFPASKTWTSETVGPESSWRTRLPDSIAGALERAASKLPEQVEDLVESRLAKSRRATWSAALGPLRERLEEGHGFVIVEPPDESSLPRRHWPALYWLLGQALGEVATQNVQGERLYHVRDTGRSVHEGARFSVTNAESTFHTDASFEDDVVDYVGLLCLQTARSGGLSQLVSGYAVARELASFEPGVLAVLARAFHVDRRGGVRPGEAVTATRPVVERGGEGLLYRYLRAWIEFGHDKAGVPLTPAQAHALDTLDETLGRADLRAEFMLRPGEMLFINNRWLLHNRTAFEDYHEPERKRHYLRLWLRAR